MFMVFHKNCDVQIYKYTCTYTLKYDSIGENRAVVARGWDWEMGRCWSKGANFQLEDE